MSKILFDDNLDLKKYFASANADISLDALYSYLDSSKQDISIITGKELLDQLIDGFNDNNLSNELEDLLPFVRKAIINMAFYRYSMSGTMLIDDNGFSASETETTKRPYQWQMRNFQRQCLRDYAVAMNELWLFLLENSGNYTGWTDTDEYLNLKERPISLLSQWANGGRRIADWRTHYALLPEMGMVWDDMENILSSDLWSDINDELTGVLSNDNKELMPYIIRYVAHETIRRAADSLPLSIEADGIFIREVESNSTNTDTAKQLAETNKLKSQATYESDRALCRLTSFLNNKSTETKYSGYYSKYIENATQTKLNNEGDKIIMF